MNLKQSLVLLTAAGLQSQVPANACTGITLKSSDGAVVAARTVEWAESVMNTMYVVVPRHQELQSLTPSGIDGMKFTTKYGFIGLSVEQKEFMVEGVNEKGLSAGLFYFPNYGEYPLYDPSQREKSLADFQLVSYVLGECSTVDEVKEKLRNIRVTNIAPRSSTVHWRFTEPSGRQVVLEIVNEVMHFYDNPLGVLTNSPDLEWHWTNLNNYINLQPGTLPEHNYGPLQMKSFGHGSGLLGLPGDFTPPSRFVRATFFQLTAPQQPSARESVFQAFHILNNFDIPTGAEQPWGKASADVPSATQFTVATDTQNSVIYYRTMYNGNIRCIDLKTVDFGKVRYYSMPLDGVKKQPVELVHIE
ncbi:choloylglycine hydrolase family protein [Bacteroides thetaiotaomicron]|uniref:choloylglycine hydrolase family protein n=1 Tax=Bacteroides thetaiotaomicron TaxID=818 RepID=UPI00232DEE84|nr:choloylglycine hydrolase family protein [Bacteroides thetaiotaomicron]MDC2244852.1 choloylglycine hydrolase family protein [Bacteroides thetaiotaomicron]